MKRRDFLKILTAIPAVAALPALAKPDNSIVFDGVNDYLKADAFVLNQPETIYVLQKQVAWADIKPKDILVYDRLLTAKEYEEVVGYMGEVKIYHGKQSKMIIPKPLPPNAKA